MLVITLNSSPAFAQAPAAPVTVVGCLQRSSGAALIVPKSPSGFVLMNASTSPAGGSPAAGSTDTGGAEPKTENSPDGSGGGGNARRSTGIPDQEPSRKAASGTQSGQRSGGGGVSPGVTFLLENYPDLAAHAGERVELRGTLVSPTQQPALSPDRSGGGNSARLPQQMRVTALRTIAPNCES